MSTPTHDATAAVAQLIDAIYTGFRRYREEFDAITRGARDRFLDARWQDVQQASVDRGECYTAAVSDAVQALSDAGLHSDLTSWRQARSAYGEHCSGQPDAELAETFFNSVFCRVFEHRDIRNENLFVRGTQPPLDADHAAAITTRFDPAGSADPRVLFRAILDHLAFGSRWQDMARDLDCLADVLREDAPAFDLTDPAFAIELVSEVFYRNKGAYLVGRIRDAQQSAPFALVVLNDDAGGLYIDNLVLDPDELSIIFSFTRSYFMVQTPEPARLVAFLNDMLPAKKRFELYNSIGFYKHGKTEFYRDLLAHLDESDDPFITAPGIRGMVMAVFTLPSYQTAFKIIKDHFPSQKDVTREQVKQAYRLVKRHDRVGRMADTQEFENLRLPRDRFDTGLLDELLEVAGASVELQGDEVVIRHVYTERMMTPLNLYLDQANDHDITEALDEYGNAIRQLAAANIFPGDMLLKNFGVTRHGRVVFYDYDEICYLTDVNFRDIPEPQTPEQEMAAEPWYAVGPRDVFPEEFPRFLFAKPSIKRLFTVRHGEIFDAAYWRGLQAAIDEGFVMDVFPYRRHRRFMARFPTRFAQAGATTAAE